MIINRQCILTCDASNEMFYEGTILNMGRGGALVALSPFAGPPPVGADLNVEVRLDHNPNYTPRAIFARGRVLRIDNGAGSPCVAIEFKTVGFASARFFAAVDASAGMIV